MEVKVKMIEYIRTEKDGVILTVPEEPVYLFLTHHRRSIGIFPQWTTWEMEAHNKPEYVYNLRIISVSTQDMDIRIEALGVNSHELGRMLQQKTIPPVIDEVLRFMLGEIVNTRTRAQFLGDYNDVKRKYHEIMCEEEI